MSNMSVPNRSQSATPINAHQKLEAKGQIATPASGTAINEKHQHATPSHGSEMKIKDHAHPVTPGHQHAESISLFSNGPDRIVDNAMQGALNKYPGAQADALRDFAGELKSMTPGELDDVKDTIVSRMSSPESSQWDRDFLQKLYNVADAVSENRKPEIPGGHKPQFPGKPGFPGKPFPRIPDIIHPGFPPGTKPNFPNKLEPNQRFQDLDLQPQINDNFLAEIKNQD